MNTKKPGDLEKVPSLMLSKDDVRPRVSASDNKRKGDGNKERAVFSTQSRLTSLIVVVLLGAVGYLYYQLYLEQQNTRSQETKLSKVIESVDRLHSQLNVQDQALSVKDGDVEKQIAVLDSEIRKLWALSNNKNKGKITSNTQLINKQASHVSALDRNVKQLQQQHKNSAKKLLDQEARLDGISMRTAELDDLKAQSALLKKKVATLENQNKNGGVADLRRRVEELELSIAAIDAHRAQVNRNINKIKKELARIAPAGLP